MLTANIIGLIAGTLISLSAIPRIIALLNNPSTAKGESILRNFMLVFGNILWVGYGCIMESLVFVIMCSISVITNSIVLYAAIKYRKQRFHKSDDF